MIKNRVVITGIGIISPCGIGINQTWNSLLNKNCCFTKSGFPKSNFCGKVDEKYLSEVNKKQKRYMDKNSIFALIAARETVNVSGISKEALQNDDVIICTGTAMGGMETLTYEIGESAKYGMNKISVIGMPKLLGNMMGANISIEYGITGSSFTYNSACSSSAVAIGEAFKKIQYNEAKIALAGGAEACIVEQVFASFTRLSALSKSEMVNDALVPFSKKRTGFVMSEGAAFLMLEEYEHALERGAKIYCEIIGYGSSADAKSLVSPDLSGIKKCLLKALADAKISENEVEYINAHGTGTEANDLNEGKAIQQIFTNRPYVSSTKSIHGHLLGATGALEACICSMMINNKLLIPQINTIKEDIDQQMDINLLTEFVNYKGGAVISSSFAFGGNNAVLVLRGLT